MSLSILISEPDREWESQIKTFLEQKSYKVDSAINGKDCQLKIYKNKYIVAVLDVETKDHSGFEVLKYIRLTAPSVKVILTVKSKKLLEELGIDEEGIKKLGASDVLVKPFALDALLKSIEGANQLESWKDIKASASQREEEVVDARDADFTRIKIEDFYSGNTTIFDCYIRLSENNYVKILHKGHFFEESRIEKYSENKEVTHLYFKTKDRAIYVNYINSVLEKMNNTRQEPIEKKVRTAKDLAEKYIEEIYTVGIKPQLIEEGKKICQNIYNLVNRDPDLSRILNMYKDYDPSAYAHLFLVSFLSAITCKNLEWASPRTVEIIVFASLFHDIGMLKLPQEIRGISRDKMTNAQHEQYKMHPKLGAEMLQKFPLVSEPVRQIVYQHHEYVNGAGFPNGLSGVRIYPPAKVVSLVDEFVCFIEKKRLPPKQGIKEFIPNREVLVQFDADIVRALIKGFIEK